MNNILRNKSLVISVLFSLFIVGCSSNENGNKEDVKLEKLLSEMQILAEETGNNIAKGFDSLISNNTFNEVELLKLHGKIFNGNIKNENLVMLGTICGNPKDMEICEELLIEIYYSENPDELLDALSYLIEKSVK